MSQHVHSHCYRCDAALTGSHQAVEHVIPSALLGKLHSRHLLCAPCQAFYNEAFGHAFTANIDGLATMLRAYPYQPGRVISWPPGLFGPKDAEVIETPTANGLHITITAHDEKQLLKALKKLKERFPRLDVYTCLNQATQRRSYLPAPIAAPFITSVPGALQAATRIAVGYFLLKGGGRDFIVDCLPFLEGQEGATPPAAFYYTARPGHDPYGPVTLQHALHLVGNPATGVLYVYISLFSTFNFIVQLSASYTGPQLAHMYVYDILHAHGRHTRSAFLLTPQALQEAVARSSAHPWQAYQALFQEAQATMLARFEGWHRMFYTLKLLESAGSTRRREKPEPGPATATGSTWQQARPVFEWKGEIIF